MEKVFELNVQGSNPCIPMPVLTEIQVNGMPGSDVMAEALFANLEVRLNGTMSPLLTYERIRDALIAVAELRVHQVRRVRPKADVDWSDFRYPAFLWPFIRSIGDVVSPEDGTELRVVWPGSVEKVDGKYVTKRDSAYWDERLETLRLLVTHGLSTGLEIAYALPRNKEGEVSVLSFVEHEGRLQSHDGGKTLHESLLRAAFGLRFVEYVWGSVRWEYQRISWYHSRIGSIVQDAFR